MNQLSLFAQVWTVSGINRYVRAMFEADEQLQGMWITGEVSEVSRPSSGHLYFTLKDDSAALQCVMWRTSVVRQGYLPRKGDGVEVHGDMSVYEATGRYQLYADLVRPAGEGERFRQFMALKARLEAEGLFDPERKRPLPVWPKRIGVVTSPTGAALQDMLNVFRRRFPLVEIVISPAPVQGEGCAPKMIRALRRLYRRGDLDVILLARGGGSVEDLWHFNDEALAREIAASPVPVVTGVGHETDFSIVDFVADVRASTPTAAAEMVSPDREEIGEHVQLLAADLQERMRAGLLARRWTWESLKAELRRLSPMATLANARQRVDDLDLRAETAMRHRLALSRERLRGQAIGLNSVNPASVLARGYAVVTDQHSGELVHRTAQATPGRRLRVRVSDGEFGARAMPEDEGKT